MNLKKKPRQLFVDMTTDQIMTTNAYRLFINRLCRSCPLKNQCSIFNKFIEQQVDVSLEIKFN
jgi:hypothetical protein